MTDKKSICLSLILVIVIASLAGCTVPPDSNGEEPESPAEGEWEWLHMFNTPSWDARYLSENIIDQFTAGITNPFAALFNFSNERGADPTSPPAYWRLGSLDTYELHDKGEDPTTRWIADERGYRVLTPSTEQEGTSYSSEIDESDRIAEFNVQLPLDYSNEIVDVTVNPNFPNYLPTTWNGEYGAFIDENSFELSDKYGNRISTAKTQTKEAYPGAYGASVNDLLGIQAYITTDETSSTEGVFEYTMNY